MTNVLIVDDEKIEREGLKYLLSREEGKRTVFEAANGKQALQVLRSEDIQLLLTDIKMPHMTGLELSKKAKEENPNLQIIIFSGFSDFTFAQEAIQCICSRSTAREAQRLHLCAGGDPLRCDRIHPQTGKSG